MALEAVLADGRVLRTGNKCIKDVTGYDLVHLLVGSEGTLAIITEITVRLLPKPQAKRTALAIFEHIEAASKAVNAILLAGVLPATLEIIDETAIKLRRGIPALGAGLHGRGNVDRRDRRRSRKRSSRDRGRRRGMPRRQAPGK